MPRCAPHPCRPRSTLCVVVPCHAPQTVVHPCGATSNQTPKRCERKGGGALTKLAKDPALHAPADLLRRVDDTVLMVMERKGEILCTGSEGCVPYETPSSTSASKKSPQSCASRIWYGGKAHIIIQMSKSGAWRRGRVKPLKLYRVEEDWLEDWACAPVTSLNSILDIYFRSNRIGLRSSV